MVPIQFVGVASSIPNYNSRSTWIRLELFKLEACFGTCVGVALLPSRLPRQFHRGKNRTIDPMARRRFRSCIRRNDDAIDGGNRLHRQAPCL